jgi:hypothetical protein
MPIEYYTGHRYMIILKEKTIFNNDINYRQLFGFIETYMNEKLSTIFAYKVSQSELRIIISDHIDYFGSMARPWRLWPRFSGTHIILGAQNKLTIEEQARLNLILDIPIIDIVKDITIKSQSEIIDTSTVDMYRDIETKYNTTLTIGTFVVNQGWFHINEIAT